MVGETVLRVCIVNSTELGFLNSIRNPRLITNDIVLLFDPRRDALVRIDGFRSRIVGLAPELPIPVNVENLADVISNQLPQLRDEGQEYYLWLDADQWSHIRGAIIQRNQGIASVIESLEAAQQTRYGELVGDDAILFDGVRLAVEIFNPGNKRDVLHSLDDARDTYMYSDITLRETIRSVLVETEFGQPVYSLTDPFHQQLATQYSRRFTESDGITQDFQNAPEGWERNSDGIPPRVLQDMVRLLDPETNRELMLLMAHQEGAELHDLAGADLIYDTVSHKSIVFVQYKRLSASGTVRPSELDQEQLNVLLNLCRDHDCKSMEGPVYLDHTAIRLGDCPVYYKLLDHDPQIDPKSKRMAGQYIQACLLKQSLSQKPSVRNQIMKRSLPHGMFYSLLGKTQIGSRAAIYSDLQQRILDFMQNKLVYAQETQTA